MKWYVNCALLISGVVAVVYFYRFAFQMGKQSCEFDSYQKIITVMNLVQSKQREVADVVQQVKNQLERSKKNDQMCDDVLRFDVRQCLSERNHHESVSDGTK